jgi:site-specific DNA-methyltransferase (adenine-specific)
MITTWTNEGDEVFDPFTGAGTTAKMCLLSNRKFQGTELSLEYCKLIEERINITINSLTKIKKENFFNPDLFEEQ